MSFGLTIISLTYILFLIVPGIFFKHFFFHDYQKKGYNIGNYADRIITSIFFGLIIQILTALMLSTILNTGFNFEIENFFSWIAKSYNQIVKNEIPTFSVIELIMLLVELSLSIFIASFLGLFCFNVISKFNLDSRFSFLRFDSPWKYVFRDDKKEFFSQSKRKQKVFDICQVELTLKDSSADLFLYSGLLKNYKTNKEGDLETISLLNTKLISKTTINNQPNSNFQSLQGHLVVFPYSNILKMNITYFYKERESVSNKFQSLIILINCVTPLPLLIYPLLIQTNLFNKIISICALILAWACFVAFSMSFTNGSKLVSKKTKVTLLILSILFLYIALIILERL